MLYCLVFILVGTFSALPLLLNGWACNFQLFYIRFFDLNYFLGFCYQRLHRYFDDAVVCVGFKQALQHDIMAEAEDIGHVLTRGQHLIRQATLVSDDVSEVENLVTSVDCRWTALRKAVSESASRLADAMPLVESFSAGISSLMAWMELAEDRYKWQSGTTDEASSSSPEVSLAPISQRLASAQLLIADIERQRPEVDSLHDASQRFLQICDSDQEIIEQRVFDMESRWTRLEDGMYTS
jgi:Spectrin repeat